MEVRKQAHDFLSTYEEKGVSVGRITAETFESSSIKDAASSTSLFGGEQVCVIDTPSSSKEMFEYIFKNLELLSDSKNVFLLIEEGLLAPQKKKLHKYSESVVEIMANKTEHFNVFALADALSRKDKKSLWLLLAKAYREGLKEEEIIGTLFWQIKTLRLAERTKNAAEAGMKDFPYSKAKRSLSKFKEDELDTLSQTLVAVYHDGHQGIRDIDVALERWVLAV